MRKWKTSFLAGLGYAGMPTEEVIASLRALGYEGIEWTTSHFSPGKRRGYYNCARSK